ncbi:MAG: N-acetylmuramoyl-L-alanine amidase [Pseudomonadota bacterium]
MISVLPFLVTGLVAADLQGPLTTPLFDGSAQVIAIEPGADRVTVVVGPGFFATRADQEIAEQDRLDAVLGVLESLGPFREVRLVIEQDGVRRAPPRRQWPALHRPQTNAESRPPLWRVDPPSTRFPYGAPLAGKTVAISAGHGWIDDNGPWRTQRGLISFDGCGTCRGIVEDFSNGDLVARWLAPYLEAAGAHVVVVRERELSTQLDLVDDGDARYSETGAWSTGSSAGGWGGDYRTCAQGSGGEAHYRLQVPRSEPLLLTLRVREGSNRTSGAAVDVLDGAGTTRYAVDMRAFGQRFMPLGVHGAVAGQDLEVVIHHGLDDGFLVADAVRLGGGEHPAGYPWWQMSAYTYVHYAEASTDVLSRGDVTIRPAYAEYAGADVYLSLHSNATGTTSQASGTTTYRFNCLTYADHSTDPPAADCDDPVGSDSLQELVQDKLVARLRASWDGNWCDRGTRVANFGELRELVDMPGALVELAFHDNVGAATCSTGPAPAQGDNKSLHEPEFRRLAGFGMYEGLLEFLAPGAPAVLPAPTHLIATSTDDGRFRVRWRSVSGARGYRVYLARGDRALDQGHDVTGTEIFFTDLEPLQVACLRIAVLNEGGVGLPGPTLCARPRMARTDVAPAEVLLVDGFDREDAWVQELDNSHDATRRPAHAVAAITEFDAAADAATDEAIADGDLALGPYRAAIFGFGLESTVDRTFTAALKPVVEAYQASGGGVVVSGAEVFWEMWRTGDTGDQTWMEQRFGAGFADDDAATFDLLATTSGPLAGLGAFSFCCDSGVDDRYLVHWPDVLTTAGSGQIALRYPDDTAAAVALTGNAPTVALGFPFETVVGATARRDLMRALLGVVAPDIAVDDWDLDGMPDAWEAQYGFDSGDSSDASADADNDGQSNLSEYQAGTNPRDGQTTWDAGRTDTVGPDVVGTDVQGDAGLADRHGADAGQPPDDGCGCRGCGDCGECSTQRDRSGVLLTLGLLFGLWRRRPR